MRVFIVGIILLGVTIYQLSLLGVNLFGDPTTWELIWPASGVSLHPAWLGLAQLVLAFWVALEGVLYSRALERSRSTLLKGEPRVRSVGGLNDGEEKVAFGEGLQIELKGSLHKKDQTIVQLNSELERLQRERAELQRALEDTTGELADARRNSGVAARSTSIDAEIVNLLAVFQEKGRFMDFLMDDISAYPDPQVGAAARVVHQGCLKALKDNFDVQIIHEAAEGSSVLLSEGFDSDSYRLLGSITGKPPFNGRLVHHGWKVTEVKLPRVIGGEERREHIVAPAEVEL